MMDYPAETTEGGGPFTKMAGRIDDVRGAVKELRDLAEILVGPEPKQEGGSADAQVASANNGLFGAVSISADDLSVMAHQIRHAVDRIRSQSG